MKKTVTITFEDNQSKVKTILTITDDVKLEIKFEPETHRDETTSYMPYLNILLDKLTE
jgi:pentose-5-phosphate-3-epimerase